MARKKILIISITAAVSVSLVLGLVVLPQQSVDLSEVELAAETAIPDLGITYIPITPMLSEYYDLEIDSGVLVTEVKPGSPMDVASVRAGDVIVSFNGTSLNEKAPLLGIIRTCRSDDEISLKLCRDGECCIIKLCCCCGTSGCECDGPVSIPIPVEG